MMVLVAGWGVSASVRAGATTINSRTGSSFITCPLVPVAIVYKRLKPVNPAHKSHLSVVLCILKVGGMR